MEDSEVGEGSRDAKQHYLQVACALQDRLRDVAAGTGDCASGPLAEILNMAAHEFGVERDDDDVSKERREGLRAEKSVMASESANEGCQHWCRDHNELRMTPIRRWRNFPHDLLLKVFSYLPVEDINRLRVLNKDWRKIILGLTDSNFHKTKMVCLINDDSIANLFWVRILDVKASKWHTYKHEVQLPPELEFGKGQQLKTSAECEDGGLVCFVTRWTLFFKTHSNKKDVHWSIFFDVMNPLTRASRLAVPPLVDRQGPKLVQIQTDRGSRGFKLFVVANKLAWTKAGRGHWTQVGVTAQLYDSLTGEWTTVDHCLSSNAFPERNVLRVTYDFTSGRLLTVDRDPSLYEVGARSSYYALYKERFFALRLRSDGPANNELSNESPTYFIEEFHRQANLWLKVKTHRCEPFEHPPKSDYFVTLRACNGFLMVTADLSGFRYIGFDNWRAWLYDLSTMKWSTLYLQELRLHSGNVRTHNVNLMFEPQWGI